MNKKTEFDSVEDAQFAQSVSSASFKNLKHAMKLFLADADDTILYERVTKEKDVRLETAGLEELKDCYKEYNKSINRILKSAFYQARVLVKVAQKE